MEIEHGTGQRDAATILGRKWRKIRHSKQHGWEKSVTHRVDSKVGRWFEIQDSHFSLPFEGRAIRQNQQDMSNPWKRQRSSKRELFTPPETNAAARNLGWERSIMHGHCLRRHGLVPHTHSSSSSSHRWTEGCAKEREVTFVVLEGPRRRYSNADGH